MTKAICFRCGASKFGAWQPCQTCGSTPISEKEGRLSLALSDWYMDEAQRSYWSAEIRKQNIAGLEEIAERLFPDGLFVFNEVARINDALQDAAEADLRHWVLLNENITPNPIDANGIPPESTLPSNHSVVEKEEPSSEGEILGDSVSLLRDLSTKSSDKAALESKLAMQSILTRYRIDAVWHFTDRSNLTLIQEHQGLLSLAESRRRGVKVPVPGGNDWSHDADEIKGVHTYVHLAFLDDHPMLFRAKQESRITDPVWLKIDASILLEEGTRFTNDVSNKSGVAILTPEAASDMIDFEVLFTRVDWKDPEINARRMAAIKSEILVPTIVPISKILDIKNG